MAGEWKGVHTSDYVIAEALNFVRAKIRRREAADALLDLIFGRPDTPPLVTSVLRVHSARFAAALELYRRNFDRGLSFTDWTTITAMEGEGIDQLATFDGGFRGLVPLVDGR